MTADEKTKDVDPELLITLLRKQLSLYRQLKRLADRQRALIAREDPQPLLALLAERQKIVEGLTTMTTQLTPVHDHWRNHPRDIPGPERQEAERLLEEVGDTLRCILNSDEEDSRVLAARKVQTANQMKSLSAGHQACQAYTASKMGQQKQYLGADESA